MIDQTTQANAAAHGGACPQHFQNAAQCGQWLSKIDASRPTVMLETIGDELERLLTFDMAPAARLEILETLREKIVQLQSASAAGYCGKAVPLAPAEHELWRAVVDVRLALAAGYEKCLAEFLAGAHSNEQQEALICQRALGQLVLTIYDYARAYVGIHGEVWKRLHELYRHAEARRLTETPVPGSGTGAAEFMNCRVTYQQALLFAAAQPYSLPPAQIECLARWLDSWAALVSLHTEETGGNPLTALAVDLDGMDGLKLLRRLQPGAGLRHVAAQRLGEKLKELTLALRQESEHVGAELGTNLARPALERLLTNLYIHWCSAGTGRVSVRSFSSSQAMITLTVPAMHFYISGLTFRQPGHGAIRQEEEDLQVFGHVTRRTIQKFVSQRSSAFEPWSIANESASGMFALCRQPDFRTRIAHGQLLGMMKRSDKPIELVIVQRLLLRESGELEVGVRRIEGIPQAVAVRITGSAQPGAAMLRDSENLYERALLLPEIPEKSLPSRLILQPGWYQPLARLDLYVHQKTTVQCRELVETGPNFELVTFERTAP